MATTAFEIGNPDGVKGHALSSYSVGCSSPWGSGWGSRIIPSPVIKVPISHIRGQRSAGRATVSTNLWGVVKNLGNALTIAKDSLIRGLDYSEIPDVAAYQDVQQQWNYGYREMLEAAIHDGNCRPTHMDIADYPKNSVSVRPLTRFSARDRLIYDALVFTMASQIDININPSVHSSRWDHGRGNLLLGITRGITRGVFLKTQRRLESWRTYIWPQSTSTSGRTTSASSDTRMMS